MRPISLSPPTRALLSVVVALLGCGSVEVSHAPKDGGTTAPFELPPGNWIQSGKSIDQVDLLLVIDNSRSMADKQIALGAALPDLVQSLVNPACVDAVGAPVANQPTGPLAECPAGSRRRFPPITDMHIGVITSSLGGRGSDACPGAETFACPNGATNVSNDDRGHLIDRLDPCAAGVASTYQGKGFLAWDPASKQSPPGEASLGAIHVDPTTGAVSTTSAGVVASLKDLVIGAGQIGCGYEASMESWYRFLIDPEPYQTIVIENGKATPTGVDEALLAQRKDFLRQGSLLAIVTLSDENDCSIKATGQFYFAAQQRDPLDPNENYHLPKARSECATDPNDPCCRSCGQDQGSCPNDPSCDGAPLSAMDDDVSLRCWDQKRRFGIDFLHPIDRYRDALTASRVPNRAGELVPNPIFPDHISGDFGVTVRNPSLVFLANIVGVPWQDLARDPHDISKGMMSMEELRAPIVDGHSAWDIILGDSATSTPPIDPSMIESTAPRSGVNPITGDAIAPPTSAPGPGPNAINGHEYTSNTQGGVQKWPDDLQYACIFDLPAARDCADPSAESCDCHDPQNDNPLCEPDPAHNGDRTRQVRAKAYPGVRQLSLVASLGVQGIAGSICAAQMANPAAPDYGVRPAVNAIVERLSGRLDASAGEIGGQCLPRALTVGADGRVACTLLEARNTGLGLSAAACHAFCAEQPGRVPVGAANAALAAAVAASPEAESMAVDCVCEIPQASGASSPSCEEVGSEMAACQCDTAESPVVDGKSLGGFCYVDAMSIPATGAPELTQNCPGMERRMLRFAGDAAMVPGSLLRITCEEP